MGDDKSLVIGYFELGADRKASRLGRGDLPPAGESRTTRLGRRIALVRVSDALYNFANSFAGRCEIEDRSSFQDLSQRGARGARRRRAGRLARPAAEKQVRPHTRLPLQIDPGPGAGKAGRRRVHLRAGRLHWTGRVGLLQELADGLAEG